MVVFFVLVTLSPLHSFGDHHISSSSLSHRPAPTTKLGTYLLHVPLPPPTTCLCMLGVVFPSKTLVITLHTLLLLFPPGTEIGVCLCRFPAIPPTHPYYNFPNASLLYLLCTGKRTELSKPPFGVQRRKSSQRGAEQSLLPLSSLFPFRAHPSPLFAAVPPSM